MPENFSREKTKLRYMNGKIVPDTVNVLKRDGKYYATVNEKNEPIETLVYSGEQYADKKLVFPDGEVITEFTALRYDGKHYYGKRTSESGVMVEELLINQHSYRYHQRCKEKNPQHQLPDPARINKTRNKRILRYMDGHPVPEHVKTVRRRRTYYAAMNAQNEPEQTIVFTDSQLEDLHLFFKCHGVKLRPESLNQDGVSLSETETPKLDETQIQPSPKKQKIDDSAVDIFSLADLPSELIGTPSQFGFFASSSMVDQSIEGRKDTVDEMDYIKSLLGLN